MFGWLAKMLVQTPVQNSCSCREGKREKLEKMRQQIETGVIEEENLQMPEDVILNCDSLEHEYVGKVLGYMISGPYPIKMGGSLPVDNKIAKDEDCNCGSSGGCCGKCGH